MDRVAPIPGGAPSECWSCDVKPGRRSWDEERVRVETEPLPTEGFSNTNFTSGPSTYVGWELCGSKAASKSHLKPSLWQLPHRGGMRSHCCAVSLVKLPALSRVLKLLICITLFDLGKERGTLNGPTNPLSPSLTLATSVSRFRVGTSRHLEYVLYLCELPAYSSWLSRHFKNSCTPLRTQSGSHRRSLK